MMPHLYIAGIRIPFQPTRFVRGGNSNPRLSRAADRQGGKHPSLPTATLPVDPFSSFHDTGVIDA